MTQTESSNPSLSPGTHLGRFELCSPIGKGGMGEVYLARDTELGRLVALKFLPPEVASDRQRMQRFINEARLVSSLNHPNILTIFEVGAGNEVYFIATEYVDGTTLQQHIREAPLTIKNVIDIALQIADALVAAHSAGIIHRDIKPENIMLRKDGIVKVLDFGLAKLSREDPSFVLGVETLVNTEPGLVLGTVSYMSPEQARGLEIDERTDIFSFGIVLYEMLAGHAPFEGGTASDVLVAILEREPPPIPKVPRELQTLVWRALGKDRQSRYQTAHEIAADLRRLKQLIESNPEWDKAAALLGSISAPLNTKARPQISTRSAEDFSSGITQPLNLSIKGHTAPEIAHVLCLDIVEYAKETRGSQRRLIDHLNAIVRNTDDFRYAQDNNWLISRSTGHGMALVFFRDPEAPVRCALQISEAIKTHPQIKLRMGIHSGIVWPTVDINGERDATGSGINVAKRVMDCGDSGHILLSKELVDHLLEVGEWRGHLHDLGVTTVKHRTKVHLFNLYVGELGNSNVPLRNLPTSKGGRRPGIKNEASKGGPTKKRSRNSSSTATPHVSSISGAIESLAVMPLANASPDPNMDYLSDGITESIINSLSQLPQVRVMARATVFRYKGKDVDLLQVGRQLGVRAVLSGKVVQIGDTLIISMELVNIPDGAQIWGEQYKRQLSGILELQEEISKTISERLRLKLTGEDRERLSRRYTEDVEAYQLYLKGRYFWSKRTREGLKKGSEYFKQAIDMDPSYALAYAGLADAYAFLGLHRVTPPNDILPKARAAAVRALEIDNTLAEGHSALAYIKTIYDWDWAGAEQDFLRSIELNSRDAPTHSYYANYLAAMGRHDEAMAQVNRAQELDPLSPIINAMVAYMAFLKRDYELALEQCRMTIEMEPNFFWIHMGFGWMHEEMGMVEQAIPYFQRAVELTEGRMGTLAGLGHAYGLAGRKKEALEVIERLQDKSQQSYVVPYDVALVYAGLGEKEQALAWLERAYQARFGWLIWINVEPKWDFLRGDPRFKDLLRRIGFPRPDGSGN